MKTTGNNNNNFFIGRCVSYYERMGGKCRTIMWWSSRFYFTIKFFTTIAVNPIHPYVMPCRIDKSYFIRDLFFLRRSYKVDWAIILWRRFPTAIL